jgi:hypothetical protein
VPGRPNDHATKVRGVPAAPAAKEPLILMATSLVIEEEGGTCTGFVHAHNGYYTGSFTTLPEAGPSQPPTTLAKVHKLTLPTNRTMWAAA